MSQCGTDLFFDKVASVIQTTFGEKQMPSEKKHRPSATVHYTDAGEANAATMRNMTTTGAMQMLITEQSMEQKVRRMTGMTVATRKFMMDKMMVKIGTVPKVGPSKRTT